MYFLRRRAWPGMMALLCLLASIVATTPLPGIDGRAYASTSPDLVVESVTIYPFAPAIGNLVTITINVRNLGDSTAGRSRILLYIDDDISSSAFIAEIYPGGTSTSIFNWKAKAGAHIVRVVVDSEDSLDEANENNNEKSYAFSVLAPDLVIENITWSPENPSIGETVYFSTTVKNQGNKPASAFSVGFYAEGTINGYRSIYALDIGEETVVNYSLIAPAGSRDIEAVADVLNQVKESNEVNNSKAITCVTATPDLIIGGMSWGPSTRADGDNVTAYVTVTNNGSGKANHSYLAFFIDGICLKSEFVETLDAGASIAKSFSHAVDANEHIIKAMADSTDDLGESDESNNTMDITIPALAPDLIVQSISWSPASPLVAHSMHFTVTVKNTGIRATSGFDLSFYIDTSYKYRTRVSPLSPGETWTVTYPWVSQKAAIIVKAIVDEADVIDESNEDNNVATASVGFYQPSPTTDLSIQSITYSPANPTQGDTVAITTVVKNQGSLAGPSHIAYYVDDILLGSVYIGQMESGDIAQNTIQWTAVTGVHQIKAIIDCNDSVSETNEANNEATVTLVTTAPDLIIQDIEWFPVNPAIGDEILFTLTIKNQGDEASGGCYVTYYIDGSSRGNHYINSIEPNSAVTRSFSWRKQAALHTLRVVIDEAGDVPESNETNNEKTLVVPAPDLKIEGITSSEDYPIADTTLSFTVSISNAGKSSAAGTSAACYIDGKLLTYIDTGVINADSTFDTTFTWLAQAGKHTLRIIADEADNLTESDESNNVKEVIIFVPLPASPDNPVPDSSENTSQSFITEPEEPMETIAPVEETPEVLPVPEEEAVPDISDNLSAPPDEASGGWKDMLMNKWLIIGVAAAGLVLIGLLLVLRKRTGQPKEEKAAPAPKQVNPQPKPAAPPPKPATPAPNQANPLPKPAAPASNQVNPPPKPAAPPPAQAPPPSKPA